jgi:hypothetical protein
MSRLGSQKCESPCGGPNRDGRIGYVLAVMLGSCIVARATAAQVSAGWQGARCARQSERMQICRRNDRY